MGFSRQEYWMVCHSLLQWTTFCQTSPPWPIHLGWPHMAWPSFTELDKAVVVVIRLASFQWLWFQCVCPLMPCLSTYHLTWVFLTFRLVAQSRPTLCNPITAARQASLCIANTWHLPKLTSIESVMPCNHLILSCPLLLSPSIFPSIMVFSNGSALHMENPLSKPERLRKGKLSFAVMLPGLYLSCCIKKLVSHL